MKNKEYTFGEWVWAAVLFALILSVVVFAASGLIGLAVRIFKSSAGV